MDFRWLIIAFSFLDLTFSACVENENSEEGFDNFADEYHSETDPELDWLIEDRISGGLQYNIAARPYQVFIESQVTGGKSFCGGSILNFSHIVTAAHCAFDNLTFLTPNKHTVYVGRTQRDGIPYEVKHVCIHTNFQQRVKHDNDIAVWLLKNPIAFNAKARPLKLASRTPPSGTTFSVSGYGFEQVRYYNEDQNGGNFHLRIAEVSPINKTDCKDKIDAANLNFRQVFRNISNQNFLRWAQIAKPPTSHMCVIFKRGGGGSCKGDSGGPLICQRLGFEPELCGVIGYGIGCGLNVYPMFMVDVLKVRGWINDNTKSNNFCATGRKQ